jgi:hypothetical protein
LKIRINNKLLAFFLGMVFILPTTAPAAIEGVTPPIETASLEKGDLNFQLLLNRLAILAEPISREGTGLLIAQAPGERYRLQFRLIARGPEAFRLEIFDPFGRPMLYIVSYLGETRMFSISQKKEIPFNQSLAHPWAAISQIPLIEVSKIFWGRVPLFPYDSYQIKTGMEEGKESIKLILEGPIQQELWIIPTPFSLTKSRIISRSKEGEVEISFSDFSEMAGNRLPMRCEIKEGTGEHILSIRYETLILRPDIPDEIFHLSNLSDSQP